MADLRQEAACYSLAGGWFLVKRLLLLLTICGLAAYGGTGCSKSSSTDNSASATAAPAETAGAAMNMGGAAMGNPTHGEQIFTQNCASCHGAAGAGGGIGPSLKGEKSRKDYAAAIAWIKNPQPPMPKLYPSPLSESDVNDVAAYVESL